MDVAEIQAIERLLTNDVLKENLAKAGLYLVAWELLKDAIIGQPKRFFTMAESKPYDDYKAEVLSLDPKSEFIASCIWFQKNEVLTADEVKEIRQIRQHRTDIAHEMPNILLNPLTQVDEAKLMRIHELVSKIDRWWITEIEMPCNEEFDGQKVDSTEIKSGRMRFLEHLISAVYECGRVH